jgi:transposase
VRAPNPRSEDQTAIHTNLTAIFVSLELSRSTWLVTSLSPGSGETMSKHSVRGGDTAGLLQRFSVLQDKAAKWTGRRVPIVVIQEAGLDGFWIHRTLEGRIESHDVDAASIAASRRRRRVKTDRIDGEALFVPCLLTSAANRVSARWSGFQRSRRKIGGVLRANAGH